MSHFTVDDIAVGPDGVAQTDHRSDPRCRAFAGASSPS
jgi:hypothetical protein